MLYLTNSKTKHSEYKHFSNEQKSFKYINIQWKFIIKEANLKKSLKKFIFYSPNHYRRSR
jgi:hypothetical protein